MKYITITLGFVVVACTFIDENKLQGAERVIYCANKPYEPSTAPKDINMCRLGLSR